MPARAIGDAEHWYDRGAEMRLLAEDMKDEEARAIMIRLANDCDKVGDRVAQRKATPAPPFPKQ